MTGSFLFCFSCVHWGVVWFGRVVLRGRFFGVARKVGPKYSFFVGIDVVFCYLRVFDSDRSLCRQCCCGSFCGCCCCCCWFFFYMGQMEKTDRLYDSFTLLIPIGRVQVLLFNFFFALR